VQDELAEHAAAFNDLSHAITDALKPIRISIGMDDMNMRPLYQPQVMQTEAVA